MDIDFKNKKVLVVGLARSGVGAANLLARLGADVVVNDFKNAEALSGQVGLLSEGVKVSLGGHPEELFLGADLIVVSPGVPMEIPAIRAAVGRGVSVIGELELAWRLSHLLTGSSEATPPFLAVTGSNGKSTTTSLLDHMMKKAGFRTVLGGNIGNALTSEILARLDSAASGPVDFVTAEISSFQLEAVKDFRPSVASILNVTPDHLDRYHSMKEYADAKAAVFSNQRDSDFLVLNADDDILSEMRRSIEASSGPKPKIMLFSRKSEVRGIWCTGEIVRCDLDGKGPVDLIEASRIKIRGVHNLENAMAAAAMALLAGCPRSAVVESLVEFGGLEHRLEPVRELRGVSYINDSKGTNVGAVLKSIESFEQPVILIAGGRDKAGDFSALHDAVSKKVRALVLIGEAAGKIKKALGDVTAVIEAADFREAVSKAASAASAGDVVLLSPACASFDMFADFEDRGRQFKKLVMELPE